MTAPSLDTDRHLLPPDLLVPEDDGACDHLVGMEIPSIALASAKDRLVNVREASRDQAVFFFYPRTGKSGTPIPRGWNEIPGARGCTPQSCSYRDHYGEFKKLGFDIYGVSAQNLEEQREFAKREHIPYELLNDSKFELVKELRLPTFEFESKMHIKRLSLVVRHGRIEKVFYPVFPPNMNAELMLRYLKGKPKGLAI